MPDTTAAGPFGFTITALTGAVTGGVDLGGDLLELDILMLEGDVLDGGGPVDGFVLDDGNDL